METPKLVNPVNVLNIHPLASPASVAWAPSAKQDFWALTSAIAMVGLSLGALLPMTSLRLNAAGVGPGTIGLVTALHALGLVLAVFFGDAAVARIGARKSIEFFALSCATVCFAMQGVSGTVLTAVALLLMGCLLGVVLNLVETWVNLVIPEAQRGTWLAIHCTMFTLMQSAGPLLVEVMPQAYSYSACAASMLCAWPFYRRLSERHFEKDEGGASHDSWGHLLTSAPVIVVSTALFALVDTVVLSLLPLYALAQGLSQSQALLSASVVLAGDTALSIAIGTLADKFGRATVHTLCAVALLTSAALLPLCVGSVLWWPVLFVTGAAAGGIYVLSLMACGRRFTGARLFRMTSILGSVWGLASIAGPLATGVLMSVSARVSLPLVLASVTGVLLISLAYEHRRGLAD